MSISKYFHINNYVFLKNGEEWIEGRIVEIESHGTRNRKYRIYSVKDFCLLEGYFVETSLHPSSMEILKKFKIRKIEYDKNIFYMPPVLQELLFAGNNDFLPLENYKIKNILQDFYIFMKENKPSVHKEELIEVRKGFIYYFNNLIPFILMEHEEPIEGDIIENYNLYHFLRLFLFIHYNLLPKVEDKEIQSIIFEYYYYIVDFLTFKVEQLKKTM